MSAAKKYTDKELKQGLNLARNIKLVQDNKNLPEKAKKQELEKLIKDNKKIFLKMIFISLHKKLWSERSLPIKMAIIGGTATLGLVGMKAVGLATMGVGIGIPAFLLSAAGGAFIGSVINEFQNEIKK